MKGIKTYSEEFGLNLKKPADRFKWFLALMLFAKRISSEIAKKTFRKFQEKGLVTPEATLEAGWDRLVDFIRLDSSINMVNNVLFSVNLIILNFRTKFI